MLEGDMSSRQNQQQGRQPGRHRAAAPSAAPGFISTPKQTAGHFDLSVVLESSATLKSVRRLVQSGYFDHQARPIE